MSVYVVMNCSFRGVYSTPTEAIDVACKWETLNERMRPNMRSTDFTHASVFICDVDGPFENYAHCYAFEGGIDVERQYEWDDGKQIEHRPLSDLSDWGIAS